MQIRLIGNQIHQRCAVLHHTLPASLDYTRESKVIREGSGRSHRRRNHRGKIWDQYIYGRFAEFIDKWPRRKHQHDACAFRPIRGLSVRTAGCFYSYDHSHINPAHCRGKFHNTCDSAFIRRILRPLWRTASVYDV